MKLLKVVIQPTFVVEDEDGNLSEMVAEPMLVTPKDWPDYPTKGFQEALDKLRAELGAGTS